MNSELDKELGKIPSLALVRSVTLYLILGLSIPRKIFFAASVWNPALSTSGISVSEVTLDSESPVITCSWISVRRSDTALSVTWK